MKDVLIIPKELITKIKNEMNELNLNHTTVKPILHFSSNEDALYNFCVKWWTALVNYYRFYTKIDIGKYKGIFPLSIDDEKREVWFRSYI